MTTACRRPASQTLSRGIRILEILADAREPLSIDELARRLDVHRSVAYRLLRTLEDHGLVTRDAAGRIQLGARMAALAAGVAHDLQAEALPELTAVANELGMTCFLVGARSRRVRHPRERRAPARGRLGRAAAGDAASGHRRRTRKGDPVGAARRARGRADVSDRAARRGGGCRRPGLRRRATTRSSRACGRSPCRWSCADAARPRSPWSTSPARTTTREIAARLQRSARTVIRDALGG